MLSVRLAVAVAVSTVKEVSPVLAMVDRPVNLPLFSFAVPCRVRKRTAWEKSEKLFQLVVTMW